MGARTLFSGILLWGDETQVGIRVESGEPIYQEIENEIPFYCPNNYDSHLSIHPRFQGKHYSIGQSQIIIPSPPPFRPRV